MKKSSIIIIIFFFLLGVLNIVFFYTGLTFGRYLTLPLMMPLLGLLYLRETQEKNLTRKMMVIAALAFSLGGDMLLLFWWNMLLFGLLSFLAAHIFYIFIFFTGKCKDMMTFPKIMGSLLVILYGEILYSVLYFSPGLIQEMRIPVLIYASTFTIGIIAAISRYSKVSMNSFWLLLLGAVLFLISDSIIAVNKFIQPYHWSFLFILSLYFTGQFFIILGLIKEKKI